MDRQPLVNLADYEEAARALVDPAAWAYLAGGAGDEITLRHNRSAFDDLRLLPRVLVDVGTVDTAIDLLGQSLASPIVLAPTAFHRLFHPSGEVATARGAAAAATPLVVSSFATATVEEIARASDAVLWFQLYVHRDRAVTRDLIERAQRAGCRALVITVDTPVAPIRDRELRARFALPPGLTIANLQPSCERAAIRPGADHHSSSYVPLLDPTLTWDTVDWIRSLSTVPVILKGVLAAADAVLAAQRGIDALVVSNHGARNLDTAPATIQALPRVAEAVAGSMPILVDGGIRRGTDIVKALALGATAVLIGRPCLHGLAVAGAEGVADVLRLLQHELRTALMLCGIRRACEVGAEALWR